MATTMMTQKNERNKNTALVASVKSANVCFEPLTGSYLRASFEEKAFESRTGAYQGLDTVLGDLVTPGDVELLQEGATLTEGGGGRGNQKR